MIYPETLTQSRDSQPIVGTTNHSQASERLSIPKDTKTENSLITFVCCVESGPLENQTLRMIESLRRWGGKLGDAPIFAVTPRWGPPLAHKTLQAFEKLNVEYLRCHEKTPYSWYNFLNKPRCLAAVEKRTTSSCLGWLDSDLLFLGEPEELVLNEGEDFVACTPDRNGATTGQQDAMEPFWKEICQAVELEIEQLPWVTSHLEGARIRLYWNGGVFVYRRCVGFAQHYLQTCIQVLDSHIVSQECDIFFHEQIALGLTLVKMGIPWRALPYSHNYNICSRDHKKSYNENQLRATRIFHYHDTMWPHFWPELMKYMGDTHPQVASWLASMGPLKNDTPFYCRTLSKIFKYFRTKQQLKYKSLSRVL